MHRHVLVHPARALVAVAVAAAGAVAAADTAVLVPVRDNTLFNNDPPASNGQGPSIFSGRTGPMGGSTVQRSVIDFRVGGIVPAGSTITSATLTLTLKQASFLGNPETHTLHRILSDWGEGMSQGFGGNGAPPEPDDATWLHTFYPDQFWTSPGGDFDPTVSSSTVIGTVPGVQHVFPSTPQMVADVQGWLDDPSSAHGWLVMGNENEDFTARRLASREGVADEVPMLTIEFTPPACPTDCGDFDGSTGIGDFLAVIAQWGMIGSSCDMGLGAQGVGIDEFAAVLGLWGPCP